jgi:UDP-glucose 4-epimerase
MKALVTGGAGFIGHHLVNLLLSKNYQVEVWDNLSTGKIERVPSGVAFKQLDLTYDIFPNDKFDAVFHLAAPTSVQESLENPNKYEQGCYMATKRLLDWSVSNGVKSFVIASTSAIYGDPKEIPLKETSPIEPMSPYAEGKLRAEQLMKAYHDRHGIDCTALRLFNVYGEDQPNSGSYAPAVALFMRQFEAFEPITVMGDGLQTRDYVYVGDVVKAFEAAGAHPSPKFRIMNVGTGEELTIKEIAESFGGEIIHLQPRIEPRRSVADTSKIKKELGWQCNQSLLAWIEANK